MRAVSEELIRVKAYELWEQSGCPQGLELEHWLLAERTLLDRAPDAGEATPAKAAAPAKRKATRAKKPGTRTRRRETVM
jgi:hypothetical protein